MSASELFVIEDYRQVYEAVALPVLIVDHASWRVLAVNEAALRQYGYARDEFVGLNVLEVRPPEGREEARKVMSELPHGLWKAVAVRHARKDGTLFTADVWSRDTVVDGRPVRIATIHEVTERIRLQQQLQQAQKMEVVGRLAGGIAHDFNNALTVIVGGSQLLLEELQHLPEARADVESILQAANRAAVLTRHLLAFGRQQIMRPETCSLTELVEQSVELLERLLEGKVEIRTQLEPDTWPVQVDPTQLDQVIVSMAVNARDAMPGGGTLVLAVANVTVSEESASQDSRVPAGDYVVLTIGDTGIGMDEITRARVFEPFFTTKPFSGGAGLGLSMAYGVVRQNGGFITVESTPGAGTTFRILLPRLGDAGGVAPPTRARPLPGALTILVVDGDGEVRRSTCLVLESLGHNAIGARSAEEALTALAAEPRVPDLLVTALTLGGIDGSQLAERLGALAPGLRVLFLSGYALEGDRPKGGLGGRRLLQKPFSVESLIEAVRQVLA